MLAKVGYNYIIIYEYLQAWTLSLAAKIWKFGKIDVWYLMRDVLLYENR